MIRFFIFIFLVGCTQVTSLNLKRHQFGIQPSKIIWLQVAGLEEDHVAMLRFKKSDESKTSFENSTCLGKAWSYNLYNLRPSASESFLAQLTGSKNIKNNCSDSQLNPIWKLLKDFEYEVSIYESFASNDQSLEKLNFCEGGNFIEGINYWKRGIIPSNAKTFNFNQKIPLKKKSIYFERGCDQNGCDSRLSDNVISMIKEMNKIRERYVFLIRDFSYLKSIKEKRFLESKKILSDLEATFFEIQKLTENSADYLVLLTTAESTHLEFPQQGVDWYSFEKNGAKISSKNSSLLNLVLATGSRAENFCGIYSESELFDRILSNPKQQGLEFKIINPFKL